MRIEINEKYGWSDVQASNGVRFRYRSHAAIEKSIASVDFSADMETVCRTVGTVLKEQKDYSGGICHTDDTVVAWADHIRSFPVYYAFDGKDLYLSNDARKVLDMTSLQDTDEMSVLEFAMAGYVTGSHTLYKGLGVLQPGEFLVWREGSEEPVIKRYFAYRPVMDGQEDRDSNRKEYGVILDRLIKKIIEHANGRTIWMPLSGGLDSRILLCKLHEHGYRNIKTFSYGPRWNFEAMRAKKIAAHLGVPWQMVAPGRKQLKKWFDGGTREAFWNYADGLKTIPCMREFSAILALKESGQVEDDAIFLNGQSGDYITGAHISGLWLNDGEFAKEQFYKVILDKHYDLWRPLNTNENYEIVKERINELLPENWEEASSGMDWARLEEIWEYDGRQICYVVNGQRIYEFLGYDWEMPLWEKELVDFCENLPLDQKNGQILYKEYLKEYNYKGLFPEQEKYIWRWSVPMLWVVPFARVIGLLFGQKKKDDFYSYMRYYGHYANQYAFFPWHEHKSSARHARNVISLHVEKWISDHKKIPFKKLYE